VRSNNGAPGIGKITLAQVEEYGVNGHEWARQQPRRIGLGFT